MHLFVNEAGHHSCCQISSDYREMFLHWCPSVDCLLTYVCYRGKPIECLSVLMGLCAYFVFQTSACRTSACRIWLNLSVGGAAEKIFTDQQSGMTSGNNNNNDDDDQ